MFALFQSADSFAQRRPRKAPLPGQMMLRERTERVLDSLELARRDSIAVADSIFSADSAALMTKSSLSVPAFSVAKDSIVEDFSNGQRKIYYYGDVIVKYDDMELKAALMEYDMNDGTVYAKGILDTLTGEWKGQPVMTQGGKTYTMEEVRYNFNSRKARITNMITTEDEGILHGRNIKMLEDRSVNITKGKYTVCNCEHPHYWLELSAAKVMTDPSQKTVFGPAHIVVEDVHIPFVGIPFGFIPKKPERATGLLMPTFGEEATRGFFLQDLGMYFVLGDYFDISVTGDIFTLGSWGIDVNSRYKVNYKFNGNFALNYSYDQTGERGTKDFFYNTNFGIKWSHMQDPKSHPGTTFSASVNFSSPSNSTYNAHDVTEALQNQISSSISYSKNWNGKMNLSVNGTHSQSSRDGSYSFVLPNVTFTVSTFYPFKRKNRVGKEKFYEKISFGYNTAFQNKVNFKDSDYKKFEYDEHGEVVKDPRTGLPIGTFVMDSLLRDIPNLLQSGMAHNFNIGLPSFQLFKYITVNPTVSYSQNWFFKKREYQYNSETDKVEAVDGKMFGAFGITQNYSFSAQASTRLYGMYNFGKHHKVQAIRHVISPSISINASPEKGTYANGYRTLTYTDREGVERTYDYNIYEGQMYSAPSRGKTASANLNIGNNIEAKVRDYSDTTGSGTKKVKIIDQLNLSTGYNFLAEQFKMSPVTLSMNTTLLGKIGLSAGASFDPYGIDGTGKRINNFAVSLGQGLLRFTNASASISYSISGEGKIQGNEGRGANATGPADYYQRIYYHPVTGEYVPGGWLYYTNPNSPWSVNFSYNFSCSRGYDYNKETQELRKTSNITQTLTISGNIKLTPRLSLTANSGFDIQALNITTTQLSATYDLHCFNISVSCVPLGKFKSYSFRIAANASALADILRFKKSNSLWDN